MALRGDNINLQKVTGISEKQEVAIENFLQGAVYCCVKINHRKNFL